MKIKKTHKNMPKNHNIILVSGYIRSKKISDSTIFISQQTHDYIKIHHNHAEHFEIQ